MKSSNVVWILLYISSLAMLSIFVLLFYAYSTLIYSF
jgi:hypothetical protein